MIEKSKDFSPSFNEDFCLSLEFSLCNEFNNSDDIELSQYWCDGVSWAPFANDYINQDYLSIRKVLKRKLIESTAWLGKSGQERYDITIILGKKAIYCYKNKKSMKHCIPKLESEKEWIQINIENRTIIVSLD